MVSRARARESGLTLDGPWRFRTDPTGRGEREEWYDPDSDWSEGRTVSVPHSWQEERDLREYTGAAWYRHTFEFDGVDDGERALLAFGAVDYEVTVWVNGERVGDHRGGYLPFDLDVTGAATAGENTVVLRVFDPDDISEIPHGKQGDPWYTRVSGPWQRVSLLTVTETHVEDVKVTPDLTDDSATVDVTVENGDGLEAAVTVSLDGTVVADATAPVTDGAASATLSIPDADYWTPESPTLYDVEVRLREGGDVLDADADYFGMRSISHDGGRLYLNGDPFTVRGALDQAFYPETFYRPRDRETFAREIRTAKDLGFNLLRKHIKPAHPDFLELADRLGILVWEEPANPSVYTERSRSEFRTQFRRLVDRDYNRPSVVVWSLYNEEWGIGAHPDEEPLWTDEEKQQYLESLYREARDLDDTRLVCDNSGWAHVATDVNDYHEYFVAPDRVDAWRERLDHITDRPGENYGEGRGDAEAPVVVSEFGTWGLSDVSRLVDSYDGDPHWFDHDFLGGLKRPSGVRDRFEESHAAGVFGSLSELADAWQRREFQSVAPMIADMREHESVAGYVITELTDVEWEFNGVLDYRRTEKSFADDFARVNAPVMFRFEPDASVAWADDTYRGDVVVANDTDDRLTTAVEWSAFGESGRLDVDVAPRECVRYEDAVSVPAPAVDGIREETVSVALREPDRTVSRSAWVVDRDVGERSRTVYAEHDPLREALSRRGYETASTAEAADVALVSDPDAHPGANALVVPDGDGDLAETDAVDYTRLPADESWNLCASFVYQDLLPAVGSVPGWAFEGIYPHAYVCDPRDEDDVAVGYLEGWLGDAGAVALTRTGGDSAGVCTLRVTDAYGEHPVATAVLDRLVELAAGAAGGGERSPTRPD